MVTFVPMPRPEVKELLSMVKLPTYMGYNLISFIRTSVLSVLVVSQDGMCTQPANIGQIPPKTPGYLFTERGSVSVVRPTATCTAATTHMPIAVLLVKSTIQPTI